MVTHAPRALLLSAEGVGPLACGTRAKYVSVINDSIFFFLLNQKKNILQKISMKKMVWADQIPR